MGIGVTIRDAFSHLTAKVKITGQLNEESQCVNLSGISPGFSIPVQAGVTAGVFDKGFSLNGAGSVYEMAVDGTTPKTFSILADPTRDTILREVVVKGVDGGIKIANFLAINSPLSIGCCLHWRSDNVLNMFTSGDGTLSPIKSTGDFARFASISGFELFVEAGGDMMVAKRIFEPGIILRKAGTYPTDDYVEFLIQDNLTTVSSLRAYARGDYVETGTV